LRSAEKGKDSPHNWRRSSVSSTPDSGINVTWTDVEPFCDLSNVSKDLDNSPSPLNENEKNSDTPIKKRNNEQV
jgi:hypothetical protein